MFTDTAIASNIVTVESTKDLFEVLNIIDDAQRNRVLIDTIVKRSRSETIIQKKDIPTRDLLMQRLELKRAMILRKLQTGEEQGYWEVDPDKSFWVYLGNKAYKRVYRLTPKGRLLKKALTPN